MGAKQKVFIDYKDISGKKRQRDYYYFRDLELKMIDKLCSLVPPFLQTHHLTLLSIPLSVLVIISGYLAEKNINWLLFTSALVAIKYFADALDGEIGRRRNTGLVKWGFFMDHFLDFVFSSSLVSAYVILSQGTKTLFFINLVVLGGFFLFEALTCISLGHYNITGYFNIGPPLFWLMVILINIGIVIFKPQDVVNIFLIATVIMAIVLIISVYKTQKMLWKIDMENKLRPNKDS